MELIDRIFLTVFARYRRKLGESELSAAWMRSVTKVAGFLILPVVAVTCILLIAMYLLTGAGTPADHKRWCTMTVIVSWLAMAFSLQARFNKYLNQPPILSLAESVADKHAVMWFRLACNGLFVALVVAGFVCHAAGLSARLGF